MFRAILILSLLPMVCLGKMINVCPSCQYTSIQQAIYVADSGDVVRVKTGTYAEHDITIDRPISLKADGDVTIDGEQRSYIIKVASDHVSISGFKLENVGVSFTKDFAAIYLHRIHHFTIENCVLEAAFFGILVEKSGNGLIRNNTVNGVGTEEVNSGNGIHLWNCDNIRIDNNHLFHLRDGIYFEFVKESTITNNLSEHNFRYGLHFMFSNHDVYTDNTFHDNGAGVAVMFSKFIEMRRNKFIKNWGSASYGLLLKEIYDAEIIDNDFIENTIAINAEGSTRVNYRNNTLKANGWAVKIAGACYANIFEANNFSSNAFDVSYNSQLNDNRFTGNYWSEYTGYDLDKDGTGDVPYRPVKLFSYIVNRTPETIVLLRSLFVDIINFSEKVSPVFTPDELVDNSPKMRLIP
ncbi:MAG: nitrous oxide reductase family maturation protein NosD [Flavobacteriales bacterium]|nr:nitrous oxide reductase family maturation protein NosD [Flavobacteriales bacterium]